MRNNKVSAVIPTRNRPDLVMRAVCSALAQTYDNLEVVVVVDGPDDRTVKALEEVHDDRLRIIVQPKAQGAQIARSAGIEAAQGDWIALLDDDDEWLPEKTSLQMERAMKSNYRYPIVSSQFYAWRTSYQLIWPRKQPCEPYSEYLLSRNSWSRGEGFLHTITLLIPKDLIASVPFTPQLQRCHDVDWVLHAMRQDGAGVEFISRPLAVYYLPEDRPSITNAPDWRASFAWVEGVRGLITRRAYAGFVATHVASQAARQRDWRALPFLLKTMLTRGAPNAWDITLFLAMWIPQRIRRTVRLATMGY